MTEGDEEYEAVATLKVEGWFSIIKRKSDGKEIYSKRFNDEYSALQDVMQEYEKYKV
ncbi:hypothetical protein [Paenibacillus foliorum]|uniref:hypothetical protein n=1 Tax=Paenibacillus foliorum TaxID=2654974 RepID=UPI00149157BE|nr:hypothetical protein [Paenibacillus foliorum]